MAGSSREPAVDPKSIGSLLDPECGIPFDVFFDLEDEADTRLGMIGGHKNILALKSSVFKAMFFGSLRETGDQIQIKATSMGAFKRMLQYAYGVEEEWYPWSLDIKEMFRLNDLAQRYDLPGLQEKVVKHAAGFLFPKDRLIEIAQTAEEFHFYPELSETLLKTCANFLHALLETPRDLNNFDSEWSQPGKSAEESKTALRLRPLENAQTLETGSTPKRAE